MINDELLHKWLNNNINSKELEEFKKRPEYDELSSLKSRLTQMEGPGFDKVQMLQKILSSKKEQSGKTVQLNSEKESKSFSIPNWLKMGVAACFLIVAGLFMWPQEEMVSIALSSSDEQESGIFPDGSEYELAAGSTLKYDKKSWRKNRNVSLEGIGKFNVKKGSRFFVDTPNGTVEVLGTEFEVASIKNQFSVSCQSGKVAVVSKITDHKEDLVADESIYLDTEGSVKNVKKNISKLKNVPLIQVQMALMDKFDVEIKPRGIAMTDLVSCNFQHENLEQALRTAFEPMHIKYEIKADKTIELYK